MSTTPKDHAVSYDVSTLMACCAALCAECAGPATSDCYRTPDGEWRHHDSVFECGASDLRTALDGDGKLLGATVTDYECPTCGACYVGQKEVPCSEECHPDRFA